MTIGEFFILTKTIACAPPIHSVWWFHTKPPEISWSVALSFGQVEGFLCWPGSIQPNLCVLPDVSGSDFFFFVVFI